MSKGLYSAALKPPAGGDYAVRDVLHRDWATIPKDMQAEYDELWMAMRPIRDFNMEIDAPAFAAALRLAGLWPSWPTVPLSMDQMAMHWCRYRAMEEHRL